MSLGFFVGLWYNVTSIAMMLVMYVGGNLLGCGECQDHFFRTIVHHIKHSYT